jgi:cytochrome b
MLWDLPTRIFHWALAVSFAGAYVLSEADEARGFHVMFGYTVLGLVAFRLVWGFIGSRASRFASFAYSPLAALGYLRDLARGRARDYAGHNPAGSWAIYGIIVLAMATGITGWLNLHGVGGEEAFEEVHEAFANAWLALVVLHVAGVVVSSLAHRRNLAASMVTGRVPEAVVERAAGAARGPGPEVTTRSRWALGSALAVAVIGFWTWAATTAGSPLLAGVAGEHGQASTPYADHEDHEDD